MSPLVGCPGPVGFLSGGAFVRGVFARGGLFPRVFCPGAFLAGGTFGRSHFCPGGLLPGGTFVRGGYARSPQVQCLYALSRLSVPSIVA